MSEIEHVPSLDEYHPEEAAVAQLQPVKRQDEPHQPSAVNGFLYGSINILGLHIPNIILLIVVVVVAYLLWSRRRTEHHLAPLVGGALETSATPGSGSFFRNLNIN